MPRGHLHEAKFFYRISCFNNTKFGQRILSKIIKIAAATRSQILRQKCANFDFGCHGSLQGKVRRVDWWEGKGDCPPPILESLNKPLAKLFLNDH